MSLQDSHQISEVKVMLMKGIDGKGISSIEKTGSQGLVDIYTITYTDGTKSTFTVTNGAGGGMSSLFIITSEAGSTISVTSPTGRPLDVTPVSGSSTQWQCETVEYGSHTVISNLGGATASATVNVDVCKIYNVSAMHFSASITATFPEGTTCQCRGTDETYFSSSSPHTFDVHSAETYTLSVNYDGTDYTTTVTITTDGQSESAFVPTPADAPADDLNLWLMYGGVSGTYSTLADVLADSSALTTLIASSDAVDYLVRCTTWANTITADSSAMSYIGLNNYCSNTLLADITWRGSIGASAYKESVLNVKNPTMTGDSSPSGLASTNSVFDNNSTYSAWKAFDNSTSSYWASKSQNPVYLRYMFAEAVQIFAFHLVVYWYTYTGSGACTIQGSNDGSTWDDLADVTIQGGQGLGTPLIIDGVLETTGTYKYYQIYSPNKLLIDAYNHVGILDLRFYGREDV